MIKKVISCLLFFIILIGSVFAQEIEVKPTVGDEFDMSFPIEMYKIYKTLDSKDKIILSKIYEKIENYDEEIIIPIEDYKELFSKEKILSQSNNILKLKELLDRYDYIDITEVNFNDSPDIDRLKKQIEIDSELLSKYIQAYVPTKTYRGLSNIDTTGMQYAYNSGNLKVILQIRYRSSKEQDEKVNDFVDNLIKTNKKDFEGLDLLYKIYRDISTLPYVKTEVNKSGINTQTAYSLLTGGGTCSAYTALFNEAATKLGYDVSTISGEIGNRLLHSWTIIKIDGKYYNIDVTHATSKLGAGWKTTYDTFLVGSENKNIKRRIYMTDKVINRYDYEYRYPYSERTIFEQEDGVTNLVLSYKSLYLSNKKPILKQVFSIFEKIINFTFK